MEEEAAKFEEKANELYAPSLEYKPDVAAIGCTFVVSTLEFIFSKHYIYNILRPD